MRRFEFIHVGTGVNAVKIPVPEGIQNQLTAWKDEKTSYWFGVGSNWLPVMHNMGIPYTRIFRDIQSFLSWLGLPATPEGRSDEALEAVADACRELGIHLVGWDAPADILEINLFRDVVLPWLDSQKSLDKLFKNVLRRFRSMFGEMVSIVQMLDRVLPEGVVNHIRLDKEQMRKLFVLFFVSLGADAQRENISSWSRANVMVSDEGEITRDDTSTLAWMIAPATTYGRISTFAKRMLGHTVGAGTFFLSGHRNINCVSLQASESGKVSRIIAQEGLVPSIHQKGQRVWYNLGAWRIGEVIRDFLGDLRKPAKAAARKQLLGGVLALEDNVVDSMLGMEFDGEDTPLATGPVRRVALTNMVGLVGSGVCFLRDAIVARDPRSLRVSMTAADLGKAKISEKIGRIFQHGEEIVSGHYNLHGYPVKVTRVTKRADRRHDFFRVRIDYDILVESAAPKFRSPGIKGSGYLWADKELFKKFGNAQIVFTQETIKQPHMALMLMAAQTLGIPMVLGPEGFKNPQHQELFLKWYQDNLRTTKIQFRVAPENEPYYRLAAEKNTGFKLYNRGSSLWCSQTVEFIVGDMPVSVEATVTELRMTRASITPHMLIRHSIQNNEAHPVSGVVARGLPFAKPLKVDDARKLIALPWKRMMKKGLSMFRNGMSIEFYESGDSIGSVEIDWRAIQWVSSGDLFPDDALSALLHEAIKIKSEIKKDSEIASEEDEEANDELYEQLSNTMRMFLRQLQTLAISPAILKRVLRPMEDWSSQLVVRMVDTVGDGFPNGNEVLVSPATLAFMRKKGMAEAEGDDFVLNRYPTPFGTKLKLRVHASVPNGVMLMNTLYQQAGNFGDADGDTDILTPKDKYAKLLVLNYKERRRVRSLINMLVANSHEFNVPAVRHQRLPDELCDWENPYETENTQSELERVMDRYHMFTLVEDSEMTKWLIQKPLWVVPTVFIDGISLSIPESEYLLTADQIAELTTFGIGAIYGMADAMTVLSAFWHGVNTGHFVDLVVISVICWWLYENKFLAGTPDAILWRFWEILRSPQEEDFDEFCAILESWGIPASDELDSIETLGRGVWNARLFCLSYGNVLRGVEPRRGWLESIGWMGEWNQLELAAFTRLAFSGSIGMRRADEPLLKPEMVTKALSYVQPGSLFGIMFYGLIETVAPMILALTARAIATESASEF